MDNFQTLVCCLLIIVFYFFESWKRLCVFCFVAERRSFALLAIFSGVMIMLQKMCQKHWIKHYMICNLTTLISIW